MAVETLRNSTSGFSVKPNQSPLQMTLFFDKGFFACMWIGWAYVTVEFEFVWWSSKVELDGDIATLDTTFRVRQMADEIFEVV